MLRHAEKPAWNDAGLEARTKRAAKIVDRTAPQTRKTNGSETHRPAIKRVFLRSQKIIQQQPIGFEQRADSCGDRSKVAQCDDAQSLAGMRGIHAKQVVQSPHSPG